MKIAIIGAGNIGGNLTRRLTHLGHEVRVANSRGPETLEELTTSTGAVGVDVAHVADGAEVVVVAVPEKVVPHLPDGLLAGAQPGVVVVDTGNYYPQQRDGRIAEIEEGVTESRWVAQQIGHPVVKAFNGIYAANIIDRARPEGDLERMALPVAGDDARAKDVVMALINELGFDAVDAGTLDDSWRQQPGTPVYGATTDANGVRLALAAAHHVRTEEWRAQGTARVSPA
ncbi:MAG: NAD(P)-binding domain-containing protein [Acidobacteria bacterium]|nr:NAD(P)-binding domain-containing protein [Acidobacteriota bacterium]